MQDSALDKLKGIAAGPKVPDGALDALKAKLEGMGYASKPLPAEVERENLGVLGRAAGNIYNVTRGFSEGAMEVAAAPVELAGILTGSDTLRDAAQGVRDLPGAFEGKMMASDGKRLVEPGFGSEVAQGFGSAAGFLAGGALMGAGSRVLGAGGKALGQASRLNKFADVALGTTMTGHAARLGAITGAQSQFRDAEAEGADPLQKWGALLGGGAIGATEGLAIGGTGQFARAAAALESIDTRSGGAISNMMRRGVVSLGTEGVEEAAQEGFQTFSEAVLAQQILKYAEPEEWDAIFNDTMRGALIGGLVGTGLSTMGLTFQDVGRRKEIMETQRDLAKGLGEDVLGAVGESGPDAVADEKRVQKSPEEAAAAYFEGSGAEPSEFTVILPEDSPYSGDEAAQQKAQETAEKHPDLVGLLETIKATNGRTVPPVVIVEKGSPQQPAAYIDGVVVIDGSQSTEVQARLAMHELLHGRARVGSEGYTRLVEAARAEFPTLSLRFAALYAADFESATGREPFAAIQDPVLREAKLIEEGFAWAAENMQQVVTELIADEKAFATDTEARTWIASIWDWLKGLVGKGSKGVRKDTIALLNSLTSDRIRVGESFQPEEVLAVSRAIADVFRNVDQEVLRSVPFEETLPTVGPEAAPATVREAEPEVTEEDQAMADAVDVEAIAAEVDAEAEPARAEQPKSGPGGATSAAPVRDDIDPSLTPKQRKRLKQKRNRQRKREGKTQPTGPDRTYRRDDTMSAAEDAIERFERGDERWAVAPGSDDLVALHNLSPESLKHAAEIGGLALPSLAIRKMEHGPITGFGGITLIADKDMVDPERGVPVSEADAWTVRHPRMEYRRDDKAAQAIVDELAPHLDAAGLSPWGAFDNLRAENIGWSKDRDEAESAFTSRDSRWRLVFAGVSGRPARAFTRPPSVGGILAGEDAGLLEYLKADVQRQIDFGGPEHRRLSDEVAAAIARVYPARMSSRADWPDTFGEDGLIFYSRVSRYEEAARSLREGRVPDWDRRVRAAKRKTDDSAYRAWFSSLLDRVWHSPFIKIGRRKVDYDLDAVVEAMQSDTGSGKEESMTFGPGKVRALAARDFGSIQEIRDSASRLTESFEEYEKGVQEPLMAAYHEAVLPSYRWESTFDALDASMRAIAAVSKGGKPTRGKLRRALEREDFTSPRPEAVEAGVRLAEAVLSAPSEYFEAKPQRAVKLSEFRGALVPSRDRESAELLESEGVPVTTYTAKQDRAKRLRSAVRKAERALSPEEADIRWAVAPAWDTPEWKAMVERMDPKLKEGGQPKLLMHGTAAEFTQPKGVFWASETPDLANEYADLRDYRAGGGGRIIPVVLDVERLFDADVMPKGSTVMDLANALMFQRKDAGLPIGDGDPYWALINKIRAGESAEESGSTHSRHDFWMHDNALAHFGEAGAEAVIDLIELSGFDGIAMTEQGQQTYAALRRGQVKSIWNQRPTSNPDMRFAVAPQEGAEDDGGGLSIQFDRLSRWQGFRRSFQDFFVAPRLLQEQIEKERGEELPDEMNISDRQRVFYGRMDEALTSFRTKELKRLESILGDKISVDEAHRYAWARHAGERNKFIYKSNDEWHPETNPGSGMRSSVATKIVNEAHAGPNAARYRRLDRFLKRMRNKSLDTLREAGELPPALDEAIQAQGYEYYVPLKHHIKKASGGRSGAPGGFQATGPNIKRAKGRKSEPDNVILNAMQQVEDAIFKAEKKRVVEALRNLIAEYPDPTFWEVKDMPVRFEADENGVVRSHWEERRDLSEDTIRFYEDGKAKAIIFNDKAQALARAFKGGNVEESGAIMRGLRAWTRYQSMINTSLNPEFVFTNFVRDLGTAGGVLTESQGRKVAKSVAMRAPAAAMGIRLSQETEASRLAKGVASLVWKDAAEEWGPWWDRLRAAGGKTGYFHAKTVEEMQRDLEKQLREATDEPDALRQAAKYGRAVLDVVDAWNEAVENGVRLSAFRYAVEELGMSEQKAAAMAKNLTVDFNTRGEQRWLSALYMFANAGIQGTTRVATSTVKSRAGRKIAASIVAFGMLIDALNRMLAPDDDDGENAWDAVPEWKKDRYLMLYTGIGEHGFLTIPLPYGYSFFYSAGRNASSSAAGATSPVETMGNIASSAMTSFSPLGDAHDVSAGSALRILSPTATDPLVELATNENYQGRPIYPEGSPFDKTPLPDSQQAWRHTAGGFRDAAALLNSATGGTKFESGAVDVHPDTLKYLVGTGLGGTLRFAINSYEGASLATKGDGFGAMNRAPFIRQVFSQEYERKGKSVFYENSQHVFAVADLIEKYEATGDEGDEARAKDLREDFGAVADLEPKLKRLERKRKKLEDEIEVMDRGAEREAKEAKLYAMLREFNREYQEALSQNEE